MLAVVRGVIKIEAAVDIDPDTLNLNSHGKWITCYVTLTEGYDVGSVDPTTIALNDIIYPDRTHVEDYDGDGVEDLMVKFSRDLVCAVLEPAEEVTLTVTGKITERVYFEGIDTIRVIDKGKQNGKEKANKNGHLSGWDDVGSSPGLELAECFVYYFHLDHLGTPQVMTDNKGEVVWQADYLPFGEVGVVGTVENNFRFPGQYFDEETGLHYNYFRYYDPGTGRYVKPDPIGLASGINLYAYVLNDPVGWIDLDGLARIRYRPIGWLGGGIYSESLDRSNRVVAHQQILFDTVVEINGKEYTDIGFFDGGGVRSDDQPLSRYSPLHASEYLDDALLARAVELTPPRKEFDLIGKGQYNCQDWIDDVLETYRKLAAERNRCPQ